MGIIERGKTTTAFLLQGLLIYQLYSTGSNLSQWPPLALPMLQIEYVTDLITSLEDRVDVLFSVCRAHAKSYSTRDKRGGGVCNDNYHDGGWTISHQSGEHWEFTGIEDEEGYDRRGRVSVGDESEFFQGSGKVSSIKRQPSQSGTALRAIPQVRGKVHPGWE